MKHKLKVVPNYIHKNSILFICANEGCDKYIALPRVAYEALFDRSKKVRFGSTANKQEEWIKCNGN